MSSISCTCPFSRPLHGVDELVHQPARHVRLSNDALLVVLTYGATQFVIIHGGPVLPDAPQSGYVSGVFDFENPFGLKKQSKMWSDNLILIALKE